MPVRMATSGADAAVPSEARRVCLIRGIATAGLVFAPAAPVAPCFAIDEDEDDDDDEAPPTPTPRPKAKRMEKAAEEDDDVDEEEAPKPEKKRRAKAPAIRTDTFELADINKDPPLGPDGVSCICELCSFAAVQAKCIKAHARMHPNRKSRRAQPQDVKPDPEENDQAEEGGTRWQARPPVDSRAD